MIAHLVFDGVADGALGVALDIAGAASRVSRRRIDHKIVSIDGKPVRSASRRRIAVDGRLSKADVVALPGLSATTPAAIEALLARPDIRRGVEMLERARFVAASCSATFVLASTGLLDGHEATTTWWLAPTFAAKFPRVTLRADRMVVNAGRAMTAGSAFAHADLMLAVLSRLHGPTLADTVARYLVLEERPSQARYMIAEHVRTSDPIVHSLERFVTANIAKQLTLDDMARATKSSPRTLARKVEAALGTTPQRFAKRLRVAHAVHLLETTRHSVDDIAALVGYADAAAFRRIFQREAGESPSTRRNRTNPRGA